MFKKEKRAPLLLIGVWSLNLIGVIGLVGIFFFMQREYSSHSLLNPALVEAAILSSPTSTFFPVPTSSLTPTPDLISSITPPSLSTSVVATMTTFIASSSKEEAMTIGYSVVGRPLEVFRFGSGADERLIVAGIHGGNEWNTIALADELIAHLEEYPETVPESVTLYILRNLNPDGEARANDYEGRANENGVDLNHNFPYHWKEEWDRKGCWNYLPTTGGTHPGSEPETIALMNFISLHDFSVLISYHSAASGIFAGGTPPFAPSERLAKDLSRVSPYSYPPYNMGCDYSGNLTDWAS